MHVDLRKDTNQDQKGNNKYHMVTAAYSTAAPRDTSVPIPTSARIAIETIHSTGIATAPTRPKKKNQRINSTTTIYQQWNNLPSSMRTKTSQLPTPIDHHRLATTYLINGFREGLLLFHSSQSQDIHSNNSTTINHNQKCCPPQAA